MKWPILLLVIFTFFSLHAQNCSYRTNTVSGMDGTRLVITEPIDLVKNFKNSSLQTWTTIYGDTALVLAFVITSAEEMPVQIGDEISLNAKDGKTINLEIYQNPVQSKSDPKKFTCLTIINNENIGILENSIIKDVVFTGSSYKQEFSIRNKKAAGAIARLIVCVKDYLK